MRIVRDNRAFPNNQEPSQHDIDDAFAWYCDFLAAQGMDVPASWNDLSHTRRHILRETASRQARRHAYHRRKRSARTIAAPMRKVG